MTEQTVDLDELAAEFAAARAKLADLRKQTAPVQADIARLKPQVTAVIVEDIRTGRRSQAEISKMTGYSAERIRQLCRAAGVERSA